MTTVRGCEMPDDLLYDVENNVWYKENDDGTVTLGMTAVAAAMAGTMVAFTPKRVGRKVRAGKSCATIESGKWVGPAKIAFAAEVVEVNAELQADPALASGDSYGVGWMLRVQPEDWASIKGELLLGSDVAGPYEAKMVEDDFAGCGDLAA